MALPGTPGQRISDLCNGNHITQKELAEKIGVSASQLSRIVSGETRTVSSDILIGVAKEFKVSTDYILGLSTVSVRKSYDISELGLSEGAVRGLVTGAVDVQILNRLLEHRNFPKLIDLIRIYFQDTAAKGITARNQLIEMATASLSDLKGLFDDIDVNSNKLGPTVAKRNDSLRKIMIKIASLDLRSEFSGHSIDLFGDAYEYLMTMYAGNAGKSGGEFFTPQEVSELLAKITVVGKTEVNKVYDPACGSGSLLLQFAKVLGKDNVKQGFFGQEINITTYNLCRINMFLHDINYEKFDIRCGDTLTDPCHWDYEPFDAIVSNPPYSTKWEGDSNPVLINDPRFAPAGVLAPKTKADLAFTMHMLSWLSEKGTAAIVEFPGVLYRGGAEQKIRKYLVENNYIDTVIQLPANLFFGVSIATCIIVLKKCKKDNKTLFIDASQRFVHEGNKNKLSPDDIKAVLDEFIERKEIKHFSALVDNRAILDNDCNLSVSSYVEAEDTKPKTDIVELNERIERIVERENALRAEIATIIKELEG